MMAVLTKEAVRYRQRVGIPLDAPKHFRGRTSKINQRYTFAGVTMTGREWAKILKITETAFLWRVRRYGDSDRRTFSGKEELKLETLSKHAWPARDEANKHRSLPGNEEWRRLGG